MNFKKPNLSVLTPWVISRWSTTLPNQKTSAIVLHLTATLVVSSTRQISQTVQSPLSVFRAKRPGLTSFKYHGRPPLRKLGIICKRSFWQKSALVVLSWFTRPVAANTWNALNANMNSAGPVVFAILALNNQTAVGRIIYCWFFFTFGSLPCFFLPLH